MKNLETIKSETSKIGDKELVYKKKEFLELQNIVNEVENILDIVKAQITKPVFKDGILVITNERVIFVFNIQNTRIFELIGISKITYKKGIMFAKLNFSYDSKDFEFDFIQNKFISNILDKINNAKASYKPKVIEIKQDYNAELSLLEKLQFKKFISENSGLDIKDVEGYLLTLSEEEKNELIIEFRKGNSAIAMKTEQSPIQQNIQIIQEKNPNSDTPSCPKCGSKQVTYNKKGFSFGKAAVGGILTGGIGLLAGGIGRNKIELTCLKCGKHWTR